MPEGHTFHAILIEWDGTHLPEGLRQLPPGRYLVEYVEELDELTPGGGGRDH